MTNSIVNNSIHFFASCFLISSLISTSNNYFHWGFFWIFLHWFIGKPFWLSITVLNSLIRLFFFQVNFYEKLTFCRPTKIHTLWCVNRQCCEEKQHNWKPRWKKWKRVTGWQEHQSVVTAKVGIETPTQQKYVKCKHFLWKKVDILESKHKMKVNQVENAVSNLLQKISFSLSLVHSLSSASSCSCCESASNNIFYIA